MWLRSLIQCKSMGFLGQFTAHKPKHKSNSRLLFNKLHDLRLHKWLETSYVSKFSSID